MRNAGKSRLALRRADKRNHVVQSKVCTHANRSRLHRFADWLNDWHITRIGASLSSLFIVLFVAASFFQLADREEERTARAWTLLTNKAPGNSGKIWALEYLNSRSLCLPFTNVCMKNKEPLTGIDLSPQNGGEGTYLEGVNLSGAHLRDAKLIGADLESANFTGADLSGANLFGANLPEADFSRANLYRANLSRTDLSWTDLSGANLSKTDLSWADLFQADLTGANLSGADLSVVDLPGANLSQTNLSGANLSEADLYGADLTGANLSMANLSWVDLYEAGLSGANLFGIDLSGTDLRTAIGLTQDQLDSACFVASRGPPKLSNGLKPPPPCPERTPRPVPGTSSG